MINITNHNDNNFLSEINKKTLTLQSKVKEKELMIREIEFEKMKIELRNAQVMAANIDFLIENGHIN